MAVPVVKITGVVLTYWTISISMVFANKYLVGDSQSDVDLSLFVAWIQCIVTVLFITLCRPCTNFLNVISKEKSSSSEPLSRSLFCARPIMTMTCLYVGMLSFNNLCLKHVGVAFFQIARSMTLIFTVLFSVLLLHKNISISVFLCCFMVAGGFILGIDQENLSGTLSVRGVCYGVITSLFVSLNGIYTKRALEVVNHDSVKLTLYNNINASVVFFPLVVLSGQLDAFLHSDRCTDPYFWLFLCGSGVLSFLIAWISAVQIDVTSPVTHHISANSKSVLQTVLAVMWFHQSKRVLWWGSMALVVTGAMSYAMVRMREDKARQAMVSAQEDLETPPEKKVITI